MAGAQPAARGIVSKDSNDQITENTWRLHAVVGLDRRRVLLWNIVPWCLGSASRIRAATRDDVLAATALPQPSGASAA